MTVSRAEREARLKAALRENLRKRKLQERAAEGDSAADPDVASAPAER